MRESVQDVLDWCDRQIDHPTPPPGEDDWDHLCMAMARTAWGQSPWATSARLAYARVPKRRLYVTAADQVPAGAICFGLLNTVSGHAWIAGRRAPAGPVGFTVDYRRRGHIDRAPLALPAWTGTQKVTWTDWSPFGRLPLYQDPRNAARFPDRV